MSNHLFEKTDDLKKFLMSDHSTRIFRLEFIDFLKIEDLNLTPRQLGLNHVSNRLSEKTDDLILTQCLIWLK